MTRTNLTNQQMQFMSRTTSDHPSLASVLVFIGLMLATSTTMSQTTDAPPVAIINGSKIPQALFERSLRQQIAMGRIDTPELRKYLLEELIAQELLYQEALRQKLDQSPGFVTAMDNARRSALSALALQSAQTRPVTDAEVRLAYERSVSGMQEEDYRLRVIVVAGEAQVKSLRSQLARGGVFEELAAAHSRLPSARAGGDIGWLNLRQADAAGNGPLPKAVAEEIRKLSKGGFTQGVFDGQGGWWLVKLEDSRPAQKLAYNEAAPEIRRVLESTARNNASRALLSNLRASAKVSQ